jgi:hypothetical protein
LNQNIPNQVFKQSLSGIYIGMITNKAGNKKRMSDNKEDEDEEKINERK